MELLHIIDFQPGFLYVFGGRPGMGLTHLTLKLANELADTSKVLFVSYQSYPLLIEELIVKQGFGVEKKLLINSTLPYGYPGFNPLRDIITQNNIEFVFIDDLDSFMGIDRYYDDNEDLIETFYRLAHDLKTAVILNLTVSQNTDRRSGSKSPKLRDFNWSRNLIELAFQVYGIYRPAYYGITQDEFGDVCDNIIEIDCINIFSINSFKSQHHI